MGAGYLQAMDVRLSGGTLLAAWPELEDPNFARSVVLLCDHTNDGAYGLVVNRPLDFRVGQLLPEHPLLGGLSTPVWLGGPVDHQRLQFIHMLPGRIQGGMQICTGLWLGGDLDALGEVLSEEERGEVSGAPVRLFLGYSGWGAGQLESELTDATWMPAAFDADLVFAGPGERAWSRVVERVDPARSREPGGDLGGSSQN